MNERTSTLAPAVVLAAVFGAVFLVLQQEVWIAVVAALAAGTGWLIADAVRRRS
jgi:drug/metabolite transporter (DMT)-like permease